MRAGASPGAKGALLLWRRALMAATGRPDPGHGVAVPGPAALNSSDAAPPCPWGSPGTAAASSRRGCRCRGLVGDGLFPERSPARVVGPGGGGGGWAVRPLLPGTAMAQRRDAPGQSLVLLPAVRPRSPSTGPVCMWGYLRDTRVFLRNPLFQKPVKNAFQKLLRMPFLGHDAGLREEHSPDKLSWFVVSAVTLAISHRLLFPSVLLPVMRLVPMRWIVPCQQ